MSLTPLRLRKLRADMRLEGKRVLIRIDGNVPLEKGRAVDGPHGRIARAAVDIDWLAQRGARVIVLTHLGRPDGRRKAAYSVKPIAKRLSSLLGTKIDVTTGVTGPRVERAVNHLKDGQILLLENLRFDPREESNDVGFAKELARLGDLYVNDAFSVSHRAHASVNALARELPAFAGHLLANEVTVMATLERRAKKPFVLLMGGLKIETKLPVIEHLSKQVDSILLGGALATTFLCADGVQVGQSVYDPDGLSVVRALPTAIRKKIVLPVDVVVASSFRKDAKTRVVPVAKIMPRDRIVDVGPQTQELFGRTIASAKTILWNGPFGYCEVPAFCKGTEYVARAIAKRSSGATTIVGGGDTGPVLEHLKLADQFTLLSTGGGAMLSFFAGQTLPGLEPLLLDV
ncbi:MAG: phosphoglycerate kinase [Patescibacteria group bacterium]